MRGHQRAHRLGSQQWHVSVDHHDGAGAVRDGVQGDPHGVPGPELLGLEHGRGVRGDLAQVGPDLVGAVPHHDDCAVRGQRRGGAQHVTEQRPAEQRVQHLGQCRLHPLALTGGENDDGTKVGLGHDVAPVGTADTLAVMLTARPGLSSSYPHRPLNRT